MLMMWWWWWDDMVHFTIHYLSFIYIYRMLCHIIYCICMAIMCVFSFNICLKQYDDNISIKLNKLINLIYNIIKKYIKKHNMNICIYICAHMMIWYDTRYVMRWVVIIYFYTVNWIHTGSRLCGMLYVQLKLVDWLDYYSAWPWWCCGDVNVGRLVDWLNKWMILSHIRIRSVSIFHI